MQRVTSGAGERLAQQRLFPAPHLHCIAAAVAATAAACGPLPVLCTKHDLPDVHVPSHHVPFLPSLHVRLHYSSAY
jgi:hypothetical protein